MTRPTKGQQQACDRLADVLVGVTEAARLDGRSTFGAPELRELARLVARASSAFGTEVIVARALEQRGRALGLRGGTVELLSLIETATPPLELLLLPDEGFRAHVEAAERELEG
jgi:hypothetical protein